MDVGIDEIVNDVAPEDIAEIQSIMGNPQDRSDGFGIVDGTEGAAGVDVIDGASRIFFPQAQGNADDIIPLLLQETGCDRTVDAAAHSYGNSFHNDSPLLLRQ